MGTIRTRAYLEALFENGDRPDEVAFQDLIATMVTREENLLWNWINNESGPSAATARDLHQLYLTGKQYPNRADLDAASLVDTRFFLVDLEKEAEVDHYFNGETSFSVNLINAEGNTPTIDAGTKISFDLVDGGTGERIAGFSYDYTGDKDLTSDTPDATTIDATNSTSGSTRIVDHDGNALAVTGEELRATISSGSVDTTNHVVNMVWNKRLFALTHNLFSTPTDKMGRSQYVYYWMVSIQEDDRQISQKIRVDKVLIEEEMGYVYQMCTDGDELGMVYCATGFEISVIQAFMGARSTQNIVGRPGMVNSSKVIADGTQSYIPDGLNWSNIDVDRQATPNTSIFGHNFYPMLVTAQAAWWGTNPGNDRAYLIKPIDNGADSVSGNLQWEQVLPDPFSGDSVDTAYLSAGFDQYNQTNSRSDIIMQDQASEIYWMQWNGSSYQRVSTTPWALDAPRFVRIDWFDANTGIIVSSAGNSHQTAFQLIEYNSGDRFEAASWNILSLSGGSDDYARNVWFHGTSNSKPIIRTVTGTEGEPVKWEWDGSSWLRTIGSTVTYLDAEGTKAEEVESIVMLLPQTAQSGNRFAFSKGRRAYNRKAHCRNYWGAEGNHRYDSDSVNQIQRSPTEVSTAESPIYY